MELKDDVDGLRTDQEKRGVVNNPMIGSYNNYHLGLNGILSGNQRWYGLVYIVYK